MTIQRLGRPTQRHLRLVRDHGLPRSLPLTRAECAGHEGPCPHVGCRHHLAVDVSFAGAVVTHWDPEEEPDRPTCSLDVAEQGGLTMEETAAILGCSRERVRQLEENDMRKMRRTRRLEREFREI